MDFNEIKGNNVPFVLHSNHLCISLSLLARLAVVLSLSTSMDLSQPLVQPSFSPLLQYDGPQARLNQTISSHMSLMSTPSASLHQPLPSLLPSSLFPFPSLIPSPLISTTASSSFHQTSTVIYQPFSSSSFPLFPSTFSSNDLADLESMLLWTLHEPSTIALTIMYCLSFILGFVGNLMALRVLTNRRSRRLAGVSATRILLVNLAVCDLAVVCVCMPVTLGSQIYTPWVYGDLLCRAVPFTQAVSVSASVLTLTVISVNRYYSVRSPLRARSMFTRHRILATVAVVWIVSSVMCAPLAVINRRREISFESFAILVCQEEWPQPRLKQGYVLMLHVYVNESINRFARRLVDNFSNGWNLQLPSVSMLPVSYCTLNTFGFYDCWSHRRDIRRHHLRLCEHVMGVCHFF